MAVCPGNSEAHFLRGELQRRRTSGQSPAQAIEAYQRAIDLDRGFSPAYRELGVLHFKMGRMQRARNYFETYLALAPHAEGSEFIRGYLQLCDN